jgi:hypothetical protein
VKAVDGEVHATGWVDQATDRGAHIWRLAKSGTLGFSFGYLIPEGGSVKRADGVREIHKLDVFEVSATPAPMNNDTRVLSTKAVEDDEDQDGIPTHPALERMLIEEGLITRPTSAAAYQRADADATFTGTGPNGHRDAKAIDPRLAAEVKMLNDAFARAEKVASPTATTRIYPEAHSDALQTAEPDTKSLPTKSTGPIQVATFEC